MNHSLVNTNKLRALNIPVHDNPFDATVFEIEADKPFTPFTSRETVISFELQVPTALEERNLLAIFLTGDQ